MRASELLDSFIRADHAERIGLGVLVEYLGQRAFGALLLLLSIPNILPVPGLSTATGFAIILVGLQMAAGRKALWLPRRVAAASFDRVMFLRVLGRARPWIERVEGWMRRRLTGLTGPTAERVLGLVIALLAAVLALPIVFGNQPPALAIALIALGMMEGDGAFVIAGLITGVLAVLIVIAVLFGMEQAVTLFISKVFS